MKNALEPIGSNISSAKTDGHAAVLFTGLSRDAGAGRADGEFLRRT